MTCTTCNGNGRTVTPWTPAEKAALTRVYPDGGMKAACEALPDRTPEAIKNKAQALGLACVNRRGGVKAWDDFALAPTSFTDNDVQAFSLLRHWTRAVVSLGPAAIGARP